MFVWGLSCLKYLHIFDWSLFICPGSSSSCIHEGDRQHTPDCSFYKAYYWKWTCLCHKSRCHSLFCWHLQVKAILFNFFPQQWIEDETEYLILFVDVGNVYFDTQSIGNRYGKLVNLGGIVGELGMFMIFCFPWRS